MPDGQDRESPVIEEREDGPLVVKNATGMIGPDGEPIEVKPIMALCRCGQSSDKPFCDGTHSKTGFKSRDEKEPSGKNQWHRYEGQGHSVLYNPRVCSHAARCVTLAPESFHPKTRPWITPDDTGDDKLRGVVRTCPSGALQVEGGGQLIPDRVTVVIQENGPYWITGAWIDPPLPAEGMTKDKYVLCRCGLSGMKPYCDGTHYNEGWRDEE